MMVLVARQFKPKYRCLEDIERLRGKPEKENVGVIGDYTDSSLGKAPNDQGNPFSPGYLKSPYLLR